MQIREIMTTQVDFAGPETTLRDLATRMRDEDVGAVPIAENDRLVGMVTDRDIVVRGIAGKSPVDDLTAREVMTERLLWCFDNQNVEDVLGNMSRQQIRRLPVVDTEKRLVGMVSLGDLSQHADTATTGEALKGISAHAS
jgi:CBS domain-containing protein